MTGNPRVSAVLNKEPRIDSGAALSDNSFPINCQPIDRKLNMSEPYHTRWDFSAAKAHYSEDELQLRQPEGFPIIPLPSTVARAFEEAEIAAAAKSHAEPEFDIYVDGEDSTCNPPVNACDNMIDTEPGATVGEEKEDDNNAEETKEASNENIPEALYNAESMAKVRQNIDPQVDTLGRTRAATSRRKVLENIRIGDTSGSMEEEGSNKKRKRGNARRSAQPRKRSTRKSY